MIINYKKSKYVTEEFEIEIEDIYNCFLQGNSENKNITEYLGIYTTNEYLIIIKIEEYSNIKLENWSNKNLYTENDIKIFLKGHKEVKVITKEIFKNKLKEILKILEE